MKLRDRVYNVGGKLELLLFRAGNENFAVPLEKIREALDDANEFVLPDMPAHVSGMLTLAGRSVPIYKSRAFLGVELQAKQHSVLIVKGEDEDAALAVDSLIGSLQADLSEIRNVAALEDSDGAFVGVFFHEGELFTLLDTAAFLRQRGSTTPRSSPGENESEEEVK